MSSCTDIELATELFRGCNATIIRACLEGTMGHLRVDRTPVSPAAVAAVLGDFAYLAGSPCEDFLARLLHTENPAPRIFIPCSKVAERLLEAHAGRELAHHTRYAMAADVDAFDRRRLHELACPPGGVMILPINLELYDTCLEHDWSRDLVAQFPNFGQFDTLAMGFVAVADGTVVSGASTYARNADAIEIEVDTAPAARRHGLARACAAALILACLERDIDPHWDAHTQASRALAESLGYRFDHAYTAHIAHIA